MAGERRLPGLGLWGYWNQGSNAWKAGTDENNRRLSAFVQGAASSRTAANPGSPADGAVWIVAANASANANAVAIRDNGETVFLTPPAGLRMFIRDTGTFAYFDGTAWKEEDAGEVYSFTGLSDTPDTLGSAGQIVAVNSDGSKLIFIDAPAGGGGGGAAELPPITNNAGKVLAVKADASGVEWITPAAGGGGGEDGGEGAAKTWRFEVPDGTVNGGGVRVAELRFYTAAGTLIPTSGAAITASSVSSGNTAATGAKAFDGDVSTFWRADYSSNEWLQVVFAAAVSVGRIEYVPSPDNYGGTPKKLVVRADGVEVGAFVIAAEPTSQTPVVLTLVEPEATPVGEAPKDGKSYVRKDGAWVVESKGSGGGAVATPFKHWRIRSVTPGSGSYFGFGEIEFRAAGTKQTGTPFSLKRYDDGLGPANSFDGDPANYYISSDNAVGNYIGLTLATAVAINEVVIYPADNRQNYAPVGFVIEASNDGTTYTEALVVTGQDWGSSNRVAKTYAVAGVVENKKHRYWRALFSGPNPAGGRADYVSLAEIQWRAKVGGASISVGGTPIASGSYSTSNTPDKAYDNLPATFWESQSGGAMASGTIWIGYDFGSPVEVGEVYLRKSTTYPNENPYAVFVQFSDDNTKWTTAHSFNTGFTATDSGTEMAAPMPGYAAAPVYVETDGSVLAVTAVTQAQFDALTTKVATKLYLVKTTSNTFKLYFGSIPLALAA